MGCVKEVVHRFVIGEGCDGTQLEAGMGVSRERRFFHWRREMD
jgi:hypothetical protein